MKLTTKFNSGDFVFFLNGTKLKGDKIHSLTINVGSDLTVITHYFFFDDENKCIMRCEDELFATKEDFLSQLDDSKVYHQGEDSSNKLVKHIYESMTDR